MEVILCNLQNSFVFVGIKQNIRISLAKIFCSRRILQNNAKQELRIVLSGK